MTHDQNNSQKIATLDPHTRAMAWDFVDACEEDGIDVWIVCARRTTQQQHALWLEGRDANGVVIDPKLVVTWADDPMKSPHVHGGAIDVCPLIAGKLVWTRHDLFVRMADIARQLGFRCGIDWPAPKQDTDHYEDPSWASFPFV